MELIGEYGIKLTKQEMEEFDKTGILKMPKKIKKLKAIPKKYEKWFEFEKAEDVPLLDLPLLNFNIDEEII